MTTERTGTTAALSADLLERVYRLAESATQSARYASDTATDAAGNVLLALAEMSADSLASANIPRLVAAAVSRLHYADTQALALTAVSAERTDRALSAAWESLSEVGQRAYASAYTNGDCDTLPLEKVQAVCAAHSGVADIPTRSVGRSTLSAAFRESERGALSDALAEVITPRRLDADTATVRRTAGARWARVSTAAGPFREITAGVSFSDPGTARGTLSPDGRTLGIDAGAVIGIRHRNSDAGNSAYTLAAVHSAESALLRGAHSAAVSHALTAAEWTPLSGSGSGRPKVLEIAAWDALTAEATRVGIGTADLLAEYSTDSRYSRNGRRIGGAQMHYAPLADRIGADPRALSRCAVTFAAFAVLAGRTALESHRVQRLTATRVRDTATGRVLAVFHATDTRRALTFTSAPRSAFAVSAVDTAGRAAFAVWESARRTHNSGATLTGRISPTARQAAYALLADAVSDAPTPLAPLAIVDRGVAVSHLSPSPACRVPRPHESGLDPRYRVASVGHRAPATYGVAAFAVSSDAAWRYVPTADALALRAAYAESE